MIIPKGLQYATKKIIRILKFIHDAIWNIDNKDLLRHKFLIGWIVSIFQVLFWNVHICETWRYTSNKTFLREEISGILNSEPEYPRHHSIVENGE